MKTILFLVLISAMAFSCSKPGARQIISPDNPNIEYTGRFDLTDKARPVFMYSGCMIRTVFTGTSVALIMKDDELRNLFTIKIDDSLFVITANRADNTYLLAENLNNTSHTLEISRRSEWHGGNTTFLGLRIDNKKKLNKPETRAHKIEFIGDSYTCGYGNEGLSQTENFKYETENHYLSFGAITARALNAEYLGVCRSGIGIVQGYGGKRDFNMPAVYDEVINNSSLQWDYEQFQPDLVVIDLIANDLSAPLDSAEFVNKYTDFLRRIRKNYAEAAIICIAGPSDEGKNWNTLRNYIHAVTDEFGKEDQKITYFEFSPFEPSGSDWHPNVAEHKNMSEELIPFIKQFMNW